MTVIEFYDVLSRCNPNYHFRLVKMCTHIDKTGVFPVTYDSKLSKILQFSKYDLSDSSQVWREEERHSVYINGVVNMCTQSMKVDPNDTIQDIKNAIDKIRMIFDNCNERTITGISYTEMINAHHLKFFRVNHLKNIVAMCTCTDYKHAFYPIKSWISV